MARSFANASSQYLYYGGEVVSPDFTVSAWFYANDAATNYYIWTQAHTAGDLTDAYALFIKGAVAGDKVAFFSYNGASYAEAVTTTGFSANTWHHACGKSKTNTDIAVLIDGGSKGTNAGPTANPVSIDNCVIGGLLYSGALADGTMDGYIAEVAVWNAELTDPEVIILSKGVSPLAVRPQSLVAYWPLIRDTDSDIVGGYSMTPINSPTVAAHPPVMYPSTYQTGLAIPTGSAAVAVNISPSANYVQVTGP